MGKRLYVGNISWNTTEDDLRSAFGGGDRTVTDCHIVTDRETGRSRGFAFVELSSDEEAKAAVEELTAPRLMIVTSASTKPASAKSAATAAAAAVAAAAAAGSNQPNPPRPLNVRRA